MPSGISPPAAEATPPRVVYEAKLLIGYTPPDEPNIITKTNQIPSYQFLFGSALVFSQSYNWDVHVVLLFPIVENSTIENSSQELGVYTPEEITEKLIIEKVDDFLKELIKWEVPNIKSKLGFQS